jgi:probable HAF family extracellular repeat protein
MRSSITKLIVLVILVLALLPSQQATAAPSYKMVDLGNLGGTISQAMDINERGQVVGYSNVSAYDWHAFLWEKGVMTDLGTLGGRWSSALAINNKGQIVGYSNTASGDLHAFLWEDGVMIDLANLPEFQQAFACQPGSGMVRPAASRCTVW